MRYLLILLLFTNLYVNEDYTIAEGETEKHDKIVFNNANVIMQSNSKLYVNSISGKGKIIGVGIGKSEVHLGSDLNKYNGLVFSGNIKIVQETVCDDLFNNKLHSNKIKRVF